MSWKRGAYPEYTLEDVVAVLFLLQNPLGRKAISETLDLGEGSVRTLLRKLLWGSLIRSARRGHSLTGEGRSIVERLSKHFSEVRKVGDVEGYPAYALLIRNPPDFNSLELRDEAIRFFAKGAMILLVKGGEPVFPEDGRPLRETMPELAESLGRFFRFSEGDLVVVTWAEKEGHAIKSAYHVALTLKGNEMPEEIKSLVR